MHALSNMLKHQAAACVSSDDEEEMISQDNDSDVAEQRDGGKVKVKWTQEEVTARTLISWLFYGLWLHQICFLLCLQDDKLKALVHKLGTSDWKSIASFIPVSDKCLGFLKK